MGKLYRFVEPVVLFVLKSKGPSYGYSLSEDVSGFALTGKRVDRAALYRTLRALEANGYVRSRWYIERSGPARRVYSLTRQGRAHLREWSQLMARVAEGMNAFAKDAS